VSGNSFAHYQSTNGVLRQIPGSTGTFVHSLGHAQFNTTFSSLPPNRTYLVEAFVWRYRATGWVGPARHLPYRGSADVNTWTPLPHPSGCSF
jgi:hypothetical protein